jgi:valyl-tRNA synthetase
MNGAYKPHEWETQLYTFWEKKGYFNAQVNSKKEPFSIILPPPNANADLHVGHAMYVYEDIMIRYNKLKGKEVLWLPGADHAGFETQFVYEKHLAKQGKSRFDFDRDTLFKDIWNFVMQNRETMENQLRKLGFALDWTKKKFTMDEDIVKIVYKTFKRMHTDGLIYRGLKLVNYCTYDGTSFSDLEVVYVDKKTNLWFLKYPLTDDSSKHIIVATTRPETMLGDTAVAVNPKDARYKDLVGKTVMLPIANREIPIIADDMVDMEFGTGAVKMTPAHDPNDWEAGQRHNLAVIQVVGFDGKMTAEAGSDYQGLYAKQARTKIAEDLEKHGYLEKVEEYEHRVGTCYKCNNPIQPLPREQWFIKVRPLAEQAKKAVDDGKITVYPKRFTKVLNDWLDKFHDWNISRQIVWGIRIPAWKCTDCNEWTITDGDVPKECSSCHSKNLTQDDDTFDTWFSSSQWPFVTLQTLGDDIYNYFYPTTVMETGYDILPVWVARMAMVGMYVTDKVPFQNVFLHGMVRDKKGQKMSKSKGNVVNPMDMIEKYGADALRATLLFQSSEGGDVNFSEDKITGMRNFINKIWNIGRFIKMSKEEIKDSGSSQSSNFDTLQQLETEFSQVQTKAFEDMDAMKFSIAFNDMYEFLWHRFADFYLEELKDAVRSGNIEVLGGLEKIYTQTLKILHPYLPFVTEAVWKSFYGEEESILDTVIN